MKLNRRISELEKEIQRIKKEKEDEISKRE